MNNLALTYDEVSALDPCSDNFRKAVKCLGGKAKWNGNKINAATAREAGFTFDMMIWLVSSVSRKDADVERRLRLWLADCAAHVLHIYEKTETSEAPRNAIVATRQFARGEIDAAARDAAWDAEEEWQYDRLVLRLSENEPEDWPLPARQKGGDA